MVRYKAAEKSILRTTCAPFNGPTNSSTDSRCRATTICPPPARREIQRSRTPDIYFGDSLSTGSPFKIECLYKSSPIRERVLNARTSPATKTQPEHPPYPPLLFPTTPFPALYFTFSLPSPPFNRLYRYAGSLPPLLMPEPSDSPASRVSSVYPSPRDQIKKRGGKAGKREEGV